MNNSDTAIVIFDNNFSIKHLKKREWHTFSPLKHTNIITRRLLNLSRRLKWLAIEKRFFNDVEQEFENYIIYDACASSGYIRWLRQKHKNARIILFYDNPVEISDVNIKEIDETTCEVWSFDIDDCQKYNIKYNSEFYFKELAGTEKKPKDYDVMFLGKDKGRYEKLVEFDKMMKKYGFSFYLHIVPDSKSKINKKPLYQHGIGYEELLDIVYRSNVLLDILQPGQVGLTLRTMEAIFNNKKLITDNPKVNQYNFYSKQNVFIWGVDPIEDLASFISGNHISFSQHIVDYYDFENWIKRFG